MSQWFSVRPTPSPRREPCCHCLFLQANLPAHHLLWELPQEQARAYAGVGQPYPGASKLEGAALHRDVRTERAAAAAAAGRAPAPTPVTQLPPLRALPFCSTAVTRKGRECTAPAAGVCLSMWHLSTWASSLPLARWPWKTEASLASQEEFVRGTQKSLPGCLCLKYTCFVEVVPEQRGTGRDCDRVNNGGRGENRRLLLNNLFSNTQCINRYPRVNREMMTKNQGQGPGTPAAWLSLLRDTHTPTSSETWTHGLRSLLREATRRAGHSQTARTKARLAAPSLAVLAASLRAWPASRPAREQGWARTGSLHPAWTFQAVFKHSYFNSLVHFQLYSAQ